MANGFTGDFVKLVPCNHASQTSFSKAYSFATDDNGHFLSFMVSTGKKSLTLDCVEDSTDYDNPSDTDTERMQHSGHYILSLRRETVPQISIHGWNVGRGSARWSHRGVDLLLAKPGDPLGKSLADVHMVFAFHQTSGFLMMRGGSSKATVDYYTSDGWKSLKLDERRLMNQNSTMIRAGACEYELVYTIPPEHRVAFFDRRDAFLEAKLLSNGQAARPLRKLPTDPSTLRGDYLEFDICGVGAFGWITHGVHIKTGNAVAIKELRIQDRRTASTAMAEVEMGKRLKARLIYDA